MPGPLSKEDLQEACAAIAQTMDALKVTYAFMGGAAVTLLDIDEQRSTEDMDLVIHPGNQVTSAEALTDILVSTYPDKFATVEVYGTKVPVYKMPGNKGTIDVEVFDAASWPQRPQYDMTTANRVSITVNGQNVQVFSPEWLFREKVLSQHERSSGRKAGHDLEDAFHLLGIVQAGEKEMDFNGKPDLEAALACFLKARPDAYPMAKEKVQCTKVFN